MAAKHDIPPAHTFAWTTVLALRALGGSGSIDQINARCASIRGLTEKQQDVRVKRGDRSELAYRLTWARTLTKALGLTANTQRGVWTLTALGRTIDEHGVDELKRNRNRVSG